MTKKSKIASGRRDGHASPVARSKAKPPDILLLDCNTTRKVYSAAADKAAELLVEINNVSGCLPPKDRIDPGKLKSPTEKMRLSKDDINLEDCKENMIFASEVAKTNVKAAQKAKESFGRKQCVQGKAGDFEMLLKKAEMELKDAERKEKAWQVEYREKHAASTSKPSFTEKEQFLGFRWESKAQKAARFREEEARKKEAEAAAFEKKVQEAGAAMPKVCVPPKSCFILVASPEGKDYILERVGKQAFKTESDARSGIVAAAAKLGFGYKVRPMNVNDFDAIKPAKTRPAKRSSQKQMR